MKISVVTPTLNSAAVLPSALRSVMDQTHREVEHIIVDGGSTDGTLNLISDMESRYRNAGKQLRLIPGPDRGLYDAMTKGVRAATGDVIGILNSDDFFTSPDILAAVNSMMEADPGVEAIYGDIRYVSRTDVDRVVRTYSSAPFSRAMMLLGFQPPHPTLYCRREVYGRFGAYDHRYAIAGDFDFMLRAIWHGRITLRRLPLCMVTMRTGGATDRSLLSHLHGLWEHQLAYLRRRVPSCILLDAAQIVYKLSQIR